MCVQDNSLKMISHYFIMMNLFKIYNNWNNSQDKSGFLFGKKFLYRHSLYDIKIIVFENLDFKYIYLSFLKIVKLKLK